MPSSKTDQNTNIAGPLNVSQDTIGRIVHKFKVKWTLAITERIEWLKTRQDLQQDMLAAYREVSLQTVFAHSDTYWMFSIGQAPKQNPLLRTTSKNQLQHVQDYR